MSESSAKTRMDNNRQRGDMIIIVLTLNEKLYTKPNNLKQTLLSYQHHSRQYLFLTSFIPLLELISPTDGLTGCLCRSTRGRELHQPNGNQLQQICVIRIYLTITNTTYPHRPYNSTFQHLSTIKPMHLHQCCHSKFPQLHTHKLPTPSIIAIQLRIRRTILRIRVIFNRSLCRM